MCGGSRKLAGQRLHALATAQHTPALAGMTQPGAALTAMPEPVPFRRAPAHYLWAVLIARIYEVFPLLCPICGGQMRIIAFITHSAEIRQILDHIRVDCEPPRLSPARGPPLWEGSDTQRGEQGQALQTGICKHRAHQTMRSISASVGEPINQGSKRRFTDAARVGCVRERREDVLRTTNPLNEQPTPPKWHESMAFTGLNPVRYLIS